MSPEYRTCPVSGRTVILAPGRAARPVVLEHFAPHQRDVDERSFCPFCPGNEWDTPDAVYEVRENDAWQLRVVPNKFSATSHERTSAYGYHEVVIECREHFADPLQLSDRQLADVFIAYRERMTAMLADSNIKSVSAFKNVGAEAGASLPHLHSQLIATPFVPEALKSELDGTARYFADSKKNVFLDMLGDTERLVIRDETFAVVCPFAPRFAHEMWLFPTASQSRFESISDGDCQQLAITLKSSLAALDRVLAAPAYNWVIHSAPYDLPGFQWHLEILPRTTRAAGFEWGTGVFINPVMPEVAAEQLRAAVKP